MTWCDTAQWQLPDYVQSQRLHKFKSNNFYLYFYILCLQVCADGALTAIVMNSQGESLNFSTLVQSSGFPALIFHTNVD